MSYALMDGTEVTAQQIREAYDAGKAVLVHGRRDGGSSTALKLDGEHIDTRGQCYSVWEEVWTRTPQTLREALDAAYYNPNPRSA